MFVFVVPLRAPHTSSDWQITLWLLRRTLRSVLAQTSNHWRLVLVGDEDPQVPELRDDRMTFLATPWRHPERPAGDKHGKLAAGAAVAFDLAGKDADLAIMPLDADDLISTRLVQAIERDDGRFAAQTIRRGYLHVPGSRLLWRSDRFDSVCGSSWTIHARKAGQVYFKDPDAFVYALKPGHHRLKCFMACMDYPTMELLFRAAVYSVSTGQNMMGDWYMRRWQTIIKNVPWRMQPINPRLVLEFPGLADKPPHKSPDGRRFMGSPDFDRKP